MRFSQSTKCSVSRRDRKHLPHSDSDCIFILLCLISVISAFYGNLFINKYNLEEKYPKLSGLIKLRIKLQHYYIVSNVIFILIALIVIIYVNFITFII